jgi:hypothetical protein
MRRTLVPRLGRREQCWRAAEAVNSARCHQCALRLWQECCYTYILRCIDEGKNACLAGIVTIFIGTAIALGLAGCYPYPATLRPCRYSAPPNFDASWRRPVAASDEGVRHVR